MIFKCEIFLFCFATGICTLSFPVKNNFELFFIFQIFKILSFLLFQKTNNPVNFFKNVFATFSKNRQFGDLFEKRFAGGICDLGGYRTSSVSNPIDISSH